MKNSMKKSAIYILGIVILAIIIIGLVISFARKGNNNEKGTSPGIVTPNSGQDAPTIKGVASPLDATYKIEDDYITLKDGKYSVDAPTNPDSSMESDTEIFGDPVMGDIGAGTSTAVMFLYQQTSGTGIFFYAVAAVKENGLYKGTNAVFLGDRIAPQNIRISNGVAAVNYVARKDSDPMTADPSVGVTKYLVIKNGMLVEK